MKKILAIAVAIMPLYGQIPAIDNTGVVKNPRPSWETQKQVRTFVFNIPAPRGQITDRNGKPLAQMRLGHNLALAFPTPLDMDDSEALAFARQQIARAESIVKRKVQISDIALLNHYRNRGLIPLDIMEDLKPEELTRIHQGELTDDLVLRQIYVRAYPGETLAAHILGYTGREAPLSVRPLENNDLLFPESEGKEGIEATYNSELTGRMGQIYMTFGAEGEKIAERISRAPVPGDNVILTLDKDLQETVEKVLAKKTKRGAMVVIDVNTGEILAMASHPTFNPNHFVPTVPHDVFDRYSNDPLAPLFPRAFRASYPPGSTFKAFTALAALAERKITPLTHFPCPASFMVGNRSFANWKKVDLDDMDLRTAMAQSCNTWFYQVGLRTGSAPIIEYATLCGLGRRTGIPLASEATGRIPTDEYMLRAHKRRIMPGDVANMSIGQGDMEISPLQMACAMGALATDGKLMQARLVKQIQSLDNRVVAAYPPRVREDVPATKDVFTAIRESLIAVTTGGTGGRASVKGVKVAGKTGTAQWGPTNNQRTAAWFAGFLPADKPRYAFAIVYESDPRVKAGGGSHAAPLVPLVFSTVFTKGKDRIPVETIDTFVEEEEFDESN